MKKYILIGAVALIVGFVVGYTVNHSKVKVGAVSSNAAYNNSVGLSQITLLPTTANGTSTSILNNGASDRSVISSYAYCQGIGSSQAFSTGAGLLSLGWTLQSATTSTANAGLLGNTNLILNTTVATTTTVYYASSTVASSIANYVWPVNTYLTFNFNATNTATCSLGATWLPL